VRRQRKKFLNYWTKCRKEMYDELNNIYSLQIVIEIPKLQLVTQIHDDSKTSIIQ
jgi:hypothetical protein